MRRAEPVLWVGLLFSIVVTLLPLPSSIAYPGFGSYSLISDPLLVIAYLSTMFFVSAIWLTRRGSRVAIVTVLFVISLTYLAFWQIVSPNPAHFNSGFVYRAFYIAVTGHTLPANLDAYATSLPGLSLIWAALGETAGLSMYQSAMLSNIAVSITITFAVFSFTSRVLDSTELGLLSSVLAVVGNQFLMRGIEVDSLYGLALLLLAILTILAIPRGGWVPRLTLVVFASASVITYPIPIVIVLVVVGLLIVSGLLRWEVLRGLRKTEAGRLVGLLSLLGGIWAAWLIYLGPGWVDFLSLSFGGTLATTGGQQSYLFSLFNSDFLSLQGLEAAIDYVWLGLVGIGALLVIFYSVRRDFTRMRLDGLVLASVVLLVAVFVASKGAEVTRVALYLPFLAAPGLATLVGRVSKKMVASALIAILVVSLPTLIAFFPDIGSSSYVVYNQTVSAGVFVGSYSPSTQIQLYGTGASMQGYFSQSQVVVLRYPEYNSSHSMAGAYSYMIQHTPGILFTYSVQLSYQITHVFRDLTPNQLNTIFANETEKMDIVYQNGLSVFIVNPR